MIRTSAQEMPVKADVCLGTDWFAEPAGRKTRVHLRNLSRLIGLGSHFVAGMLRWRSRIAPQGHGRQPYRGIVRIQRHKSDTER